MRFQRDLTTDELRLHLVLIHGMYVNDVKTREGLDEAHRDSHLNPDRPYYIDHFHDGNQEPDEPVEEPQIEEWVW